jgi:hypothetical protein
MLFGSEKIQNTIIDKANDIAVEIDGKIIFGAMVGSISQGVHTVDSDYDTRFLYIRNDFPEKIWLPDRCKESDIVKRYYPKSELFYDKVPLWELLSFLQFMLTPSIEGKFSAGLHHIVAWTFLSPFLWDPYGLANKLSPLLQRMCNYEYELQYHISKIEEFFKQDENILIKNYLYATIAAASINYIQKEHTFAPIHIDSLMGLEMCEDIKQIVYGLIEKMRRESAEFFESSEKFVLQGSHYKIRTGHNQQLDKYILEAYQKGKEMLNGSEKKNSDIDSETLLKQMYMIVQRSLEEQIVKALW